MLSYWLKFTFSFFTLIDPDTGEITHTKDGNESDTDSELSVDRNSLDLASSHSSDEDDEFDLGPQWETPAPKSKAVGETSSHFGFH